MPSTTTGSLDLDSLYELDDGGVRARLTALKGIGPWTADVYLVMVLRRPDAFPTGDLALQVAAGEVKELDRRLSAGELELLAEPWRPYRATAARLLWLHYLGFSGFTTSDRAGCRSDPRFVARAAGGALRGSPGL